MQEGYITGGFVRVTVNIEARLSVPLGVAFCYGHPFMVIGTTLTLIITGMDSSHFILGGHFPLLQGTYVLSIVHSQNGHVIITGI